jgi:hypothetical protein
MPHLVAALLLPFLIAAGPVGEGEEVDYSTAIAGRLVDADGRPVAGATAGTNHQVMEGAVPTPVDGMVSDFTGAFSGTINVYRYPVTLVAYGDDGALAGWAQVEEDDIGDVVIELRPAMTVRATITRDELEAPLTFAGVSFTVAQAARVSTHLQAEGEVELVLPRGDLSWTLYDDYFSMVNGQRALEPEQFVVDLGALDIPAHFLAKNVGKVLPDWTVSASRNVPLDQSSLAAHRGKWLLIEFWGFW